MIGSTYVGSMDAIRIAAERTASTFAALEEPSAILIKTILLLQECL